MHAQRPRTPFVYAPSHGCQDCESAFACRTDASRRDAGAGEQQQFSEAKTRALRLETSHVHLPNEGAILIIGFLTFKVEL